MLHTYGISATTTGAAGSATGSGKTTQVVSGFIIAVHVAYTSQPGTADVTITTGFTTDEAGAVSETLMTLTNSNTDAWYYPRTQITTDTGNSIAAQYASVPIDGYVTVSVADGDAATDAVKVTLVVERY